MKISEFKAGRLVQQFQYQSFSPNKVNHEWLIDDGKLTNMLSKADYLLGQLDAFSILIPDIGFFIKMHKYREATQSSKIEGTQTNLEEAIQKMQDIEPEKREGWQEINNYINAMNYAIDELPRLPLCNRLLREAHALLLQNVRGEFKAPGEFRTSQNWIGGANLTNAIYIPPHPNEVVELMSDLEMFLQNDNLLLPPLLKIGIAHYQFETIHPFCDGNGRIGRLLITLFLVNEGLLKNPSLYLSDFFEKNRTLYYDNLMLVRLKDNMTQWLYFFLDGVIQTANDSIETFHKILKIKESIEKEKIPSLGKKVKNAHRLLQYLFSQPIICIDDLITELGINKITAHRLINDFMHLGILKESTGYKRNRIFVFDDYFSLFT